MLAVRVKLGARQVLVEAALAWRGDVGAGILQQALDLLLSQHVSLSGHQLPERIVLSEANRVSVASQSNTTHRL